VRLAIDVTFHREVDAPIFAFFVRAQDGRLVYNQTTHWMNVQTGSYRAGERCRVEFDLSLPLLDGTYEIGVDVSAADLSHYYDRVERGLNFAIRNADGARGLVDLGASVKIQAEQPDREPL
jgi:hypothetical protein